MNKEEYLKTVRKQILYVFERDSIGQELSQHLDDSIEDLIENGYEREEAERIAVEQMGDPIETGKMLNQEHHPVLGYLYLASKIILAILSVPILYAALLGGIMFIRTMTPVVVEHSIETYSVDMDVKLNSHHLKLDNICLNENGQYYITFREWVKWDYSRITRRMSSFWIADTNGEYDSGAYVYSSGFGMGEGYIGFDWPEDGVLHIKTVDGKHIKIELEEYCYE